MNGTDGEGLLVEKRTVENEIYWDLGRFWQSQIIYWYIENEIYWDMGRFWQSQIKWKWERSSWQVKCSMFFQGDRLHSGLGLLLLSHGNRQQAPWPSTPILSFFPSGWRSLFYSSLWPRKPGAVSQTSNHACHENSIRAHILVIKIIWIHHSLRLYTSAISPMNHLWEREREELKSFWTGGSVSLWSSSMAERGRWRK